MSGNNRIRITYDPYRKEITCEYQREGGDEWEMPSAGGKLAAIFQQGTLKGTVQNNAHSIVQGIVEDYCTYGQGVDLLFHGVAEDWDDLKAVVQAENIDLQIICKGMTAQLPNAGEILPKIKGIFQTLSDEFEGLTESEVKKPIEQFLETVEPDVVLYVSGVYSAGKSTFINALIGEELLPSSVDPTTAHIFKIVAKAEGNWLDTEVHFKYLGKDATLKFRPDGYLLEDLNQLPDKKLKHCLDQRLRNIELGPAYICEALTALNSFNAMEQSETEQSKEAPYISPQIELRTPLYHSSLPLEEYKFLLFDTPGTNAENHEEHLTVMKESLEEQTNGLPILLVPPTQTDAKDVGNLRREIHEIGGALDESNILIVVTQADKELFGTLKRQACGTGKLAARNGAENRTCYTSAVMGFYAKKGSYPAMGSQSADDLEENKERFDASGAPYRNGRTRLYQIDSLPQDQLDYICQEGDQANDRESEQEKLFHNSGLWAVEREIEWFARRFAGYNKCWQAKGYLSEAIEELKKSQERKREREAELKRESEAASDKQKETLKKKIRDKSDAWRANNIDIFPSKQKAIIHDFVQRDKRELLEKIPTQWESDKKLNKGKFGLNALDQFRMWASREVSASIDRVVGMLEKSADNFWDYEINSLKNACINIVKGSAALTAEEKEFIGRYILEIRPPKIETVHFALSKESTKSEFLFFHWASVKPERCAAEMSQAVMDACTAFNGRYLDSIQQEINEWVRRFEEGLEQRMSELNPKLAELKNKIQRCTEEIEALNLAYARLEKAQEELDSYFTLQEAGSAK